MDKVQSENQFPKIRCAGKYAKDPLYLKYHDEEWGRPLHDEKMLYEMFVIELFQAGLSWRTLLHKRKNFEAAYDGFELEKVAEYGEEKIENLMQDEGIIRSLPKIRGSIINSRIIRDEILPGEQELMDDKPVDPSKLRMTAVQCPNCGASYQAAAGYTGRCPYCGSYHNVE